MAKSICDFIRDLNGGVVHDELSNGLADLVAAVTDEGKSGTMTVTFSLKPMGKGNGIQVSSETKVKPPKQTAGVTVMFATPENSLQRQDPRQKEMELREIGPAMTHRGIA